MNIWLTIRAVGGHCTVKTMPEMPSTETNFHKYKLTTMYVHVNVQYLEKTGSN